MPDCCQSPLPHDPWDNHKKEQGKQNEVRLSICSIPPNLYSGDSISASEYRIAFFTVHRYIYAQIRHTVNEGQGIQCRTQAHRPQARSPKPYTPHLLQEYALNAHLPIIIFSASSQSSSTFLKSHIVDGRFLFWDSFA